MRNAIPLLLMAWLVPAPLCAQAWLPGAGQGTISVIYQNMQVRDHLAASGLRVPVGTITSNNLLLDVSYGLTDKFAVSLSLPYIASRYNGPFPHPYDKDGGAPYTRFDNGGYHGALQDSGTEVGQGGDADDHRNLGDVLRRGQGQPAGWDHPAG